MSQTRPYKGHKKPTLIKALTRLGSITKAARASRISVDAVRDWRRNDASFERMVQQAIRNHNDADHLGIDSALAVFDAVARRAIPAEMLPRLSAELAIAVANLKRDLIGGARSLRAPSGNKAELSLSPTRLRDVAIPHRGNGDSAVNL